MSEQSYLIHMPFFSQINDPLSPRGPFEDFLQRCETLSAILKNDRAKLLQLVEEEYLDTFQARIEAARFAQSKWMEQRFSQQQAREEFNAKEEEALQLRRDVVAAMRYAFRNDPKLLKKVTEIADGDSKADLFQDLSDLGVLGTTHADLLQAINFDMQAVARCAELGNELAKLYGISTGADADVQGNHKTIRDQAYTHVKQAADEIIAAGKYCFRNEPQKLKSYKASLFR